MTTAGTTAGAETVVRRYLEEVINRGDPAAADELLTPTFTIDHAGVPEVLRGPEAFKAFLAGFREAFPDIRGTVEDVVAAGDKVAVRLTWRGTHRGTFQGIAPTGKAFTVRGSAIYRLEGGRIAAAWAEFDTLSLLQQLGALPAPGQPATGGAR
jgi:steroid delta-isomerase-like uncharacterized protein